MTTPTFTSLGLNEDLLKALATEGYTTPTPIQARAIPSLIEGRDLLGIAQTGTGKTAAFALPILHRLAAERRPTPRRGVRALVLSPTRELANQIADSFKAYGRHTGFSVATVYGGVGHRPQALALQRGLDIVVATPGRLIDHINERNVDLSQTEILVLDEADQMMDLGFIRPLRQIIAKLSMKRQSMFFSATMPHEIGALAAELLRDPVEVSVTPVAKTADRVAQKVIFVEQPKKKSLLVELFADASLSRTLVFTRTKRGADRVARHLEQHGIAVAAIHGNKSQNQREAALASFKAGKIRGLVATDIAARGIDVDEVSHVVNYELPNIPESYVHRIGRTARAGAEGIAISLVDGEERAYLRDIERLTRQQIPNEDRRNDTSLAVEERVRHTHADDARGEDGRGDFRRGGRPNAPHAGRGDRASGHRGRSGERRGERKFGERKFGDRQQVDRTPADRDRGEPARTEAALASGTPDRSSGARPHAASDRRSDERPRDDRRGNGHRSEGRRTDGHRAEGHRAEGHRSEGHRSDARGSDANRSDSRRHDAPRDRRPDERPRDDRFRDDRRRDEHRPRSDGHRAGAPRQASRDHVHEVPFGASPQRPDGAVKRNRDFEAEGGQNGARNGARPARGGHAGHGPNGHRGRPNQGHGRSDGHRADDRGPGHARGDGARPPRDGARPSRDGARPPRDERSRRPDADGRRAAGGANRPKGEGNGWGRRPR